MASPVPGMAYQLHIQMEKRWQIHFGFRQGNVFVQAIDSSGTYEYIPDSHFKGSQHLDLPLVLIENCAHWLHIGNQTLECRRLPRIWDTARFGNWLINLKTGKATRRESHLIDPFSPLFRSIANIFSGFVDSKHLTVYQSRTSVHVEIKHISLSFQVTKAGALACKELRALVDRSQDAGTLYGLGSMIVMCDIKNHSKRSLIVPMGTIRYRMQGFQAQVVVDLDSQGAYAQFGIDWVLGRLTCAPEPRLLYFKAQLHAYTSFLLPDTLTSRTGTEEALHILNSAICQPWVTLTTGQIGVLAALGELSPKRMYYPDTIKVMEKVVWKTQLPWWSQHDSFRPVVAKILAKSQELSTFGNLRLEESEATNHPEMLEVVELRRRAELRRSRFDPGGFKLTDEGHVGRRHYVSRFSAGQKIRQDVRQILQVLIHDQFCIRLKEPLIDRLASWKWMCPATTDIQSTTLVSTLLNSETCDQWWSYVRACVSIDGADVSFMLATLANVLEMDLLMVLAAVARVPEVRKFVQQPPDIQQLVPFRKNDEPNVAILTNVVNSHVITIGDSAFSRERDGQMAWADKTMYDALCSEGVNQLIDHVVEYWPSAEVYTHDFSSETVDIDAAVVAMGPEWARAYQNHKLEQYVDDLSTLLDTASGLSMEFSSPDERRVIWYSEPRDSSHDVFTLARLAEKPVEAVKDAALSSESTAALMGLIQTQTAPLQTSLERQDAISELQTILDLLTQFGGELYRLYAYDLQASLRVLRDEPAPMKVVDLPSPVVALAAVAKCRHNLALTLGRVRNAVAGNDPRQVWLRNGNLWPSMSAVSLLEMIRVTANINFGHGMKEVLVTLGLAVTMLQKFRRIEDAVLRGVGAVSKLQDELLNPCHTTWSPLEHPDWLLLEIDSDILIRPDQIDVAMATIQPVTGKNSVLQMNMGRGESTQYTRSCV